MRGIKNQRRIISLLLMASFAICVFASIPVKAERAIAATNLLINPGAETGDLSGWWESHTYEYDIWRSTESAQASGNVDGAHSGDYFFIADRRGIANEKYTFLCQFVDTTSYQVGDVFELSCFAHTYSSNKESDPDYGRLYLEFLGPKDEFLYDENDNAYVYTTVIYGGDWTQYSVSGALPEGCTKILVGLMSYNVDNGVYPNVSWDDVSLVNLGQ